MYNIPEIAFVFSLIALAGIVMVKIVSIAVSDNSSNLSGIDADFVRTMNEIEFDTRYNKGP